MRERERERREGGERERDKGERGMKNGEWKLSKLGKSGSINEKKIFESLTK